MHEFVPVPTAPKWTGHHCEPFKKKCDHLARMKQAKPRQGEPVAVPENSCRLPYSSFKQAKTTNKRNLNNQTTSPISLATDRLGPVQGTTRSFPTQLAPSPPPEDAATRGRRTSVFQRILAAFPTHMVPSAQGIAPRTRQDSQ